MAQSQDSGGGGKDSQALTEGEVALLAAFRTVIDIILNTGIAPVAAFEEAFAHQREGYIARGLPKTAGILEHLRLFAINPKREASRQAQRHALSESPKGEA